MHPTIQHIQRIVDRTVEGLETLIAAERENAQAEGFYLGGMDGSISIGNPETRSQITDLIVVICENPELTSSDIIFILEAGPGAVPVFHQAIDIACRIIRDELGLDDVTERDAQWPGVAAVADNFAEGPVGIGLGEGLVAKLQASETPAEDDDAGGVLAAINLLAARIAALEADRAA